MAIKPIDIEAFSDRARNIHEAIVATSKRARQINEEIKIEFAQRIELFAPKTEVAESEESDINPDQLKVSLEFEKRAKPTDLSLDELMEGRLSWRYKEREEPVVAKEKEEGPPEEDEGEEE
jgi:DNA-directed RNA polymerase subunit K/omega